MKTARSLKSVKSDFEEEKIKDLDELIINACQKFNCSYNVVVNKEAQREDFYRSMKKTHAPVKYKKITMAPSQMRQNDFKSDKELAEPLMEASKHIFDDNDIVVTAIYDIMNNLTEIALNNLKRIPRLVIQVIGYFIPFYAQLTKITMMRSRIDKYTIHELNKVLPFCTITEICFDGSPFPEANYAILLDGTNIRNLSLSRCRINDVVCKDIFARLHFLHQAETMLAVLNLSSNHITDVGVKYIGEALRTNRHLRHLNLADNRITDDGANHIFNILAEFPLTCDEIYSKRHRHLDYLKTKHAMIATYLSKFVSKSLDDVSYVSKKSLPIKKDKNIKPSDKNKSTHKKEKYFTDDDITAKAEMTVLETIGPYIDPFDAEGTKVINGLSHCKGNLTLCYLNMSYNHLTYSSLKKILAIVQYQQIIRTKPGQGLIKILIDGNNLPIGCSDMATLNDILNRNMNCFGGRAFAEKTGRRKSRVSMVPDRTY